MLYNWATCSSYFPGFDVDAWWTDFCEASDPPNVHTYYGSNGGPDIDWTIYEHKIFTSRWDQCLAYSDNAAALTTQRNNWLPAKCNDFQFEWAYQYAKNGEKHWDDCIPYWGPVYNTWLTTPTTTTTAAPTSTTLVPTTTVPAPPTSIDINS
jgi:hypothetical protein